jgi:hypothetical protein
VGQLFDEVREGYGRNIRGRPVESSLVATCAYLLTLGVVRAFILLTRDSPLSADISIGGIHIHHEVFGVLILLIAGVMALDEVFRLQRAALFGLGAALVLDEFALIVYLQDVYWLPQGVLSVMAIAVGLAALLVNAWRGRAFLRETGAVIRRRLRRPA